MSDQYILPSIPPKKRSLHLPLSLASLRPAYSFLSISCGSRKHAKSSAIYFVSLASLPLTSLRRKAVETGERLKIGRARCSIHSHNKGALDTAHLTPKECSAICYRLQYHHAQGLQDSLHTATWIEKYSQYKTTVTHSTSPNVTVIHTYRTPRYDLPRPNPTHTRNISLPGSLLSIMRLVSAN